MDILDQQRLECGHLCSIVLCPERREMFIQGFTLACPRFSNCVLFYLKMNLQLLEREGLQFPENVPVMADFEVLAQFGCCKILSDRLQCARSGKTCSQLTKCEAVPFTSIK